MSQRCGNNGTIGNCACFPRGEEAVDNWTGSWPTLFVSAQRKWLLLISVRQSQNSGATQDGTSMAASVPTSCLEWIKKLRLQGNDFLEETRRYSQTDLRHQQVASRQISLELQPLLLPLVKITIYSDDDSHTFGHPNSRTFGQWFRCR